MILRLCWRGGLCCDEMACYCVGVSCKTSQKRKPCFLFLQDCTRHRSKNFLKTKVLPSKRFTFFGRRVPHGIVRPQFEHIQHMATRYAVVKLILIPWCSFLGIPKWLIALRFQPRPVFSQRWKAYVESLWLSCAIPESVFGTVACKPRFFF